MENELEVNIPLDVAPSARETYVDNYRTLTSDVGRVMLMAGDQKVEHLNDDFVGPDISPEDGDPEHLFQVAAKARIGAFATHLGLIARYGADYPSLPYLVKLNGKTNLMKTDQRDPVSRQWHTLEQLARFRDESGLKIVGVGFTIYPGSQFEHEMLIEATRLIFEAHQMGLVTILWAYPRGKAVTNELDPHLIAGVTGLAGSLGTDFVKVNYPHAQDGKPAERFKEAVLAAGRTKVICAGGKGTKAKKFLARLHDQIHISGAIGNATGRNIHQLPLDEAVRFCNAIYAVSVENRSVDEALAIYQKK
ncbi:beta/alpha barrel domain-containing protein [Gimesia algae]|uniref:fructose-bisphosphate aldolase n=1 Tax=Gimesia algae TaxID=2527971 RepID=A0A517VKR1_9PLAN|nr:aldolase [Gimesia algae]QDT93606.1 Fructose-bisphosphate aldolase class 1 [Gimesia algae]